MPPAARRTRLATLLLAGSIVAGACGTDGSEVTAVTSSSTTTVPVAPAPGDPVPTSGDGEPASAPEDPGRPLPPTSTPSSTTSAPEAPGGTAVAPPASVSSAGPVGSLAARYLRPDGADQVLVQALVQDGASPRRAVLERVRSELTRLSAKPVSLAVAPVAGGPRQWTGDDLRALADRSSPGSTPEQAVLTLLFLRGGFAENERAVGVAVRGDVAAVFAERVDEAAGLLGSRSAVEDAVTMHEVGHLLGLVDLVLDTGRQDPDHPGHSPNRGSVMYHAVESTLLGSLLSGGPPRTFDQADLDDLARIRNG